MAGSDEEKAANRYHRFPPSVPNFVSVFKPDQASLLREVITGIIDSLGGDPAGGKAPRPGTPSIPTGTGFTPGVSTKYLREDAGIKQGVVSVKGDLLGFGTKPARVPSGWYPAILKSDIESPHGVYWDKPWNPWLTAVLVDSELTEIAIFPLAADGYNAVVFRYQISAIGAGAEGLSESGILRIAGVRDAIVQDAVIELEIINSGQVIIGAGTLGVVWSIEDTGDGMSLKVTATNSLTVGMNLIGEFLELGWSDGVTFGATVDYPQAEV